MTSIASSIHPREPAIRDERSWRVVLVGQSLAKRDWDAAPDSRVGIGGDCTFEGLPKAARSLDFRALRVLGGNRKTLQSAGLFVTLRSNFRLPSKEIQMAFCSACGS